MNNDYNQNYVNTGERPQNMIYDPPLEERFAGYPHLNQLLKLKDDLLRNRNHPPLWIKQDPKDIKWDEIGQFDVILIDPPWMEYKIRLQEAQNQLSARNPELPLHQMMNSDDERFDGWSKEDIATLQIEKVSKTPSFLFLWVGSTHLDEGRDLLKRWGFKRCEDIVWLKTNKTNVCHRPPNDKYYLQHVKEHCLVGVKGDVKRASDSHIIHANIDTDIMLAEEPLAHNLAKPTEIYDIIERFCLGRRRLQLFINDKNKPTRPGWIVFSKNLQSTSIDWEKYNSWLSGEATDLSTYIGGEVIGTTPEIEDKRPKSPKKNPSSQMQQMSGSGMRSMII